MFELRTYYVPSIVLDLDLNFSSALLYHLSVLSTLWNKV